MGLENKTIITAAITGAVTPKSACPWIPLQPEEIVEDAYKCWKAGASVVHLHMRNDEGIGEMNKEKFKKTIEMLRGEHPDCDIIINCTTAGESNAPAEKRMAHVKELDGIEMASYDAGSFNWMPAGIHDNSPQFLEELGKILTARKIKPEYEIFDTGMMGIVDYYVKQGVLVTPGHYAFVLGVVGGMAGTVDNLLDLYHRLPEGSTWAAFGIGKSAMEIMYATIAMHGNIRVGLEDNVYLSRGVKGTNEQFVQRAKQAVELFGREVATPAEAREMLGIPQLVNPWAK